MEIARLVLEYVKTLLAPQAIVGALALVFLFKFKDDVKALMLRIARITFPGGAVETSQAAQVGIEQRIGKAEPPTAGTEQLNLPAQLTPQTVEALVRAERATGALWEYRYLNYFLVYNTQRVLDWLAGLTTPASTRLYDSFWLPLFPSANERQAIITALQAHNLVVLHDDLIEVTPKGREYIQWRGTLPPPVDPMLAAIGRALAAAGPATK